MAAARATPGHTELELKRAPFAGVARRARAVLEGGADGAVAEGELLRDVGAPPVPRRLESAERRRSVQVLRVGGGLGGEPRRIAAVEHDEQRALLQLGGRDEPEAPEREQELGGARGGDARSIALVVARRLIVAFGSLVRRPLQHLIHEALEANRAAPALEAAVRARRVERRGSQRGPRRRSRRAGGPRCARHRRRRHRARRTRRRDRLRRLAIRHRRLLPCRGPARRARPPPAAGCAGRRRPLQRASSVAFERRRTDARARRLFFRAAAAAAAAAAGSWAAAARGGALRPNARFCCQARRRDQRAPTTRRPNSTTTMRTRSMPSMLTTPRRRAAAGECRAPRPPCLKPRTQWGFVALADGRGTCGSTGGGGGGARVGAAAIERYCGAASAAASSASGGSAPPLRLLAFACAPAAAAAPPTPAAAGRLGQRRRLRRRSVPFGAAGALRRRRRRVVAEVERRPVALDGHRRLELHLALHLLLLLPAAAAASEAGGHLGLDAVHKLVRPRRVVAPARHDLRRAELDLVALAQLALGAEGQQDPLDARAVHRRLAHAGLRRRAAVADHQLAAIVEPELAVRARQQVAVVRIFLGVQHERDDLRVRRRHVVPPEPRHLVFR